MLLDATLNMRPVTASRTYSIVLFLYFSMLLHYTAAPQAGYASPFQKESWQLCKATHSCAVAVHLLAECLPRCYTRISGGAARVLHVSLTWKYPVRNWFPLHHARTSQTLLRLCAQVLSVCPCTKWVQVCFPFSPPLPVTELWDSTCASALLLVTALLIARTFKGRRWNVIEGFNWTVQWALKVCQAWGLPLKKMNKFKYWWATAKTPNPNLCKYWQDYGSGNSDIETLEAAKQSALKILLCGDYGDVKCWHEWGLL